MMATTHYLDRSDNMLTIVVVLVVLWALGLFSGYALGGLIHLLLLAALVVLVFQFLQKRRVV